MLSRVSNQLVETSIRYMIERDVNIVAFKMLFYELNSGSDVVAKLFEDKNQHQPACQTFKGRGEDRKREAIDMLWVRPDS